jgi:hypothetical protein
MTSLLIQNTTTLDNLLSVLNTLLELTSLTHYALFFYARMCPMITIDKALINGFARGKVSRPNPRAPFIEAKKCLNRVLCYRLFGIFSSWEFIKTRAIAAKTRFLGIKKPLLRGNSKSLAYVLFNLTNSIQQIRKLNKR